MTHDRNCKKYLRLIKFSNLYKSQNNKYKIAFRAFNSLMFTWLQTKIELLTQFQSLTKGHHILHIISIL